MKITNDKFIRTTDQEHVEAVQKIFKKLYDQGDIYKSEYEGWYCTPCESFWTETQLADGKCPDCGREVELTKEESYFFRLSKYQDQLIRHLDENPDFIQPVSRKNEMINNFIKPGLEDLCVSRTSFKWGIPVTFDEKHVVYVWIDALSNYITALGYLSENDADFRRFWPADVHLVGKEIVRFHTIIWPAMLMALNLPLPKQVYGHGWLVLEGGKMSKSKGNVIDPVILIEKYGLDAIRYFLLREVPFGSDGVFSNEALIQRINSDLANDLGNLISRTVAMIQKYFSGKLPEEKLAGDHDDDLISVVTSTPRKVEELLDQLQFSTALSEIWKAVSRTNKYIDETMPWILAKDEDKKPRLAQVLYNLVESIRIISILIQPFMPETPHKIWEQTGICENCRSWENAFEWGKYSGERPVSPGGVIFPRINIEKELAELEKINTPVNAVQKIPGILTQVGIDDFAKLDLRVARVIECEKVEKSEKLLKLKLDIGIETRQVVSGIAKFYKPEELIGKNVIMIANLKPAKLMGIESQGMILAAVYGKDEKLAVVTVDADMPLGSRVS